MAETNGGLDAFRTTAPYYEVLFESAPRLKREGPCLLSVLERAPGRRVVDLATGTGPHALFFAENGAEVDAFDLSEEMISHAQAQRPHNRIRYGQGDMRQPEGGPWDLAICLGNSLSLLPSYSDVAATFASLRQRLSPGGLFLLQVLNYGLDKAQEPRHRVVRKEHDGAEIVAVKSLVPQEGHTLLSLSFFASKGEEQACAAEAAVLLHLDRETLQSIAEERGFALDACWGDFEQTPFDEIASSDLIMVFRRID
jgi:2-polyprenyl-3-methyl-5-hydroxy-6-metoxy-1,4-benzoquinol methylase